MDLEKLKEEQIKLAKKIVTSDSFEKTELIAAADQSFFENKIISAIVVCDENLQQIERKYAMIKAPMPYVPNYLSFREAPAVVQAYSQLKNKPDILMCDFNGILHPRRFGAACQVGLSLNLPTIGVAKNLIIQTEEDKIYQDKELVAEKVYTKPNARPLYVSPGHLISLKTSIEIVKKCIKIPHKLPEPLHLAHRYAKKLREKYDKETGR